LNFHCYLPVCPFVKKEFVDENIWFDEIPPLVILLSFSIGLSVVLFGTRDDEKWLLFNERLLGICGLAAEFVVVADDEGVLVE
jgi:hypothetical protein